MPGDKSRSKDHLIAEISELRQKYAKLEADTRSNPKARSTDTRFIHSLGSLIDTLNGKTRDEFFTALVATLAEWTGADCAVIGKLTGDKRDTLEPLAMFHPGHQGLLDPFTLADSPAFSAGANTVWSYPVGVERVFPNDKLIKEVGATGWAGTNLFDINRNPIGLLITLFVKPIPHPEMVEALLTLLAARAAFEIERLQIDETLRSEREMMGRIADTAPIGITILDRQGHITFANSYMEQRLGLSKKDITQRYYNSPEWKITDADGNFLPDDQLPFSRVLASGKSVFDTRHAIELKTGERLQISINAAPLFDEKGQFDGMVAAINDITAQITAQQALRVKDKALASSSAAYAFFNLKGVITEVNQAFVTMWGCNDKAAVLGSRHSGLWSDPTAARLVMQQIRSTGAYQGEITARKFDGSTFVAQLSATLVTDERGRPNCVMASLIDLGDRRRIELAVHRVIDATDAVLGDRYFEGLVIELSRVLAADYVFVGELFGPESCSVRTLALCAGGEIGVPVSYDLESSPCAKVIDHRNCRFQSGVQRLFAHDILLQELGIEGFLGVALTDSKHTPIGILVALFQNPVTEMDFKMAILEVVAGRTAAELERFRVEAALIESERKSRAVIESIPIGMHMYRRDPDDRLVFVGANPAADRILKVENQQFIGKTIEEAFPPLVDTDVPAMYRRAAREGVPWQTEQITYEHGEISGAYAVDAFQTAPDQVVAAFLDITERKRSEAALRESEFWIRESQRVAQLGSYVLDFKSGLWTSSAILDEIFGIDLQYERSVEGWSNLVHPEHRREMIEYFTDLVAKRTFFDKDYRIVRPSDGAERWVHGSGELSHDADGNLAKMVGTIQDITERKKVEEALSREAAFNAELADLSSQLLVAGSYQEITDLTLDKARRLTNSPHGYVGYIDPATGYLVSPTLTRDIWTECRVADKDVVFKEFTGLWGWVLKARRPLFSNDPKSDPRSSGTPKGHVPITRLLSVPALDGGELVGQISLANANRDYTDKDVVVIQRLAAVFALGIRHIQAEQALVKSEEHFRSFLEHALVGAYRITPEGRFLLVNLKLAQMLGYSSVDELLADSGSGWIGAQGSNRDDFRHTLDKHGLISGFESIFVRPDGSKVFLRESARVVRDEQGNIKFVEGTVEDLTTQVNLQNQLIQAQKMEAVGRLAGGIAHDFNNVLQALSSLTQVLPSQRGDPTRFATSVTEIIEEVKRGAALTRQLLLFSRQEVRKLESVELSEVARQSAHMLRRLVREDISFSVQLAHHPLHLKADRSQLEQVLMNLVVNAADAMPDGGNLTIRTLAADGWGILEVVDSGCGMNDDVRLKAFEPFFTTKDASKGTGLGLSVVHGIVTGHGGRVEVESEVGKGSTFHIFLPLVAATSDRDRKAGDSGAQLPVGAGERVLVVEDERGVRDSLVQILEMLGYKAVAVGNGESARQLPPSPPFEVLLTDLLLPDLPGSQVAAELAARWPQLKVIMMSGYTDAPALRKEITLGEVHFLQKPFDMKTLARELQRALDRSESSE